jgi:hypothetical protein
MPYTFLASWNESGDTSATQFTSTSTAGTHLENTQVDVNDGHLLLVRRSSSHLAEKRKCDPTTANESILGASTRVNKNYAAFVFECTGDDQVVEEDLFTLGVVRETDWVSIG